MTMSAATAGRSAGVRSPSASPASRSAAESSKTLNVTAATAHTT
jgi:hypothetical protein